MSRMLAGWLLTTGLLIATHGMAGEPARGRLRSDRIPLGPLPTVASKGILSAAESSPLPAPRDNFRAVERLTLLDDTAVRERPSTPQSAKEAKNHDTPDRGHKPDKKRSPASRLRNRLASNTLHQAIRVYQTKLGVIANNLANAETIAFKRSRVVLGNLPYDCDAAPGKRDQLGEHAPLGISVGTGVRVLGTRTDFSQGTLIETGTPLDLAIKGRGFFQVGSLSGEIRYTRAGSFATNSDGDLVLGSSRIGYLLEPPITIPNDATAIVVTPSGSVSVRQPGIVQLTPVGQIELARFINPEGLLKQADHLYSATEASGPPTACPPGQEGLGSLQQGSLEASNVDLEAETLLWRRTSETLDAIRRLLPPR